MCLNQFDMQKDGESNRGKMARAPDGGGRGLKIVVRTMVSQSRGCFPCLSVLVHVFTNCIVCIPAHGFPSSRPQCLLNLWRPFMLRGISRNIIYFVFVGSMSQILFPYAATFVTLISEYFLFFPWFPLRQKTQQHSAIAVLALLCTHIVVSRSLYNVLVPPCG